jgi:glycosyltransferase involved in cell wall biosynthesis
MRIGFDATVLAVATRYTGTGQYAEKLIATLPLLAPDDEFVLYGSPPPSGLPEPPANVTWRPLGRLPFGRLSALAGHLITLPRLARKDRLDMLHVPTVHTRASLPPVPRALPCPLVVTIHDLIPLNYYGRSDKPLPWRLRTFYRWNLKSALKAQRIITVSETSRSEILSSLGLPPDRVVAIHNGVDFAPAAGRMSTVDWKPPHGDAPYVLFGGSFEPRKNLLRLIEAFDAAVQAGLGHHLLMIVDSASGHAQPVMHRAQSLACAERLHFLSGLDEPTIQAVYRGADVFIFPTLSEGFGLPPLQAMACGVPVIASDLPVMREVLGDAAYYVDPYSIGDITRSLMTVTSDDSIRRGLSEAGPRRAANFTWEATARQTLEVYRSVVKASRSPATAGRSQI